LPCPGGTRVRRTLKAGPKARQIPIIVLTASVDPERLDAAVEAGAARALRKPCMPGPSKLRSHARCQAERSAERAPPLGPDDRPVGAANVVEVAATGLVVRILRGKFLVDLYAQARLTV